MNVEIERRFLASDEVLAECRGPGRSIVQGYLWSGLGGNTRIRIDDDHGVLTCKGPKSGCSRHELEFAIPVDWALLMLKRLPPDTLVRKTRYEVPVGGLYWEVDVFEGRHQGLIIAEVELSAAGQNFLLPNWVVREVTSDSRFGNSSLARAQVIPVAA